MHSKKRWTAVIQTLSVISLLSFLVMMMLLTGCSKVQAAVGKTTAQQSVTTKAAQNSSQSSSVSGTPTTTTTTTTPPITTPAAASAPKTTTKAAPTTVPKITEVSCALTLDAQQNYAECTTPIYLNNSQTLHLTWVVVKGGDHFFMTFTKPNGELIAVRFDGSMTNLSPGTTSSDTLMNSGDMILCLDKGVSQEGYYIFHPQIHHGDTAVTVKLLYWIEG